MSYRNEMKEDFKGVCLILAVVCTIVSITATVLAIGIFFVRGCVPALTAASDKFAERVVESMGEDFEEHSWKIDKKDGSEGTKEDGQNEKTKINEQDATANKGPRRFACSADGLQRYKRAIDYTALEQAINRASQAPKDAQKAFQLNWRCQDNAIVFSISTTDVLTSTKGTSNE